MSQSQGSGEGNAIMAVGKVQQQRDERDAATYREMN
jgi:hypothetical protein